VNTRAALSNAQRQAAATRQASGPSVKLLSRPDSPNLTPVPPDARFGPAGFVRPLWGYDANQPPPKLPAGAKGAAMQPLTIEDVCDALAGHLPDRTKKRRQARMRGARAILRRLMGFPGDTWEQRWLASGCDAAPRGWIDYLDVPTYDHWSPALLGMHALLHNRVIRPSYSWLLDSGSRVNTRTFLNSTGASALDKPKPGSPE
jgi:hypothetical protein